MKTVLEAALEVQRKLIEGKERFCFIGAIALQRWGEPRATRDVDATVLVPFGASRTRDWADIEALVARRGASLDWDLVLKELAPLAAARDMPEILDRLRAMKSAS